VRLIEVYSQFCGVKPSEPYLNEEYYPVPISSYVVVHNGSGMPSKSYDNFSEVTKHIKMSVVQVGGKDDPLLENVVDLRGKTTWGQTFYLIKNSLLFLGCDSICNHMASALNIPRIALFGATSPLTCGGYWNKETAIELTPTDMQGCAAPCHNSQCIRAIKCINSITPESILEKISSILGKEAVTPVEILHTGKLTNTSIVEWIPMSVNQETFNVFRILQGVISLRADLHTPDLNELSNFCNQTPLKYILLIKPGDFTKFSIHHSKVEQLLILVDSSTIAHGIALMKDLTKKLYKVRIISRLDHAVFNDFKLDIMDYPPIARLTEYEYTKEECSKLVGQNVEVSSLRKIVGNNGKAYMTFHDALKDKNSIEIMKNTAIITIEEEHLKELQFLTIRKY